MAQPYVGEIRMFAGNFAPAGWMFCEGQLLPISEYETLFTLIGTTYGGDGQSTFALPDLRGTCADPSRGRFRPCRNGRGRGDHPDRQSDPGAHAPDARFDEHRERCQRFRQPRFSAFVFLPLLNAPPPLAMAPQAVSPTGGSQPHTNFQPYLCVDFIISLFGIFPSPT